ncbi:MAG: DUF2339 domain-containing protein [Saprospiraceae bacterium]|nr:DUF2339 domain-containing protein [Saprospiraceae bacterium]
MSENNEKLEQLLSKLESLIKKQDEFANEINQLKKEIQKFKSKPETSTPDSDTSENSEKVFNEPTSKPKSADNFYRSRQQQAVLKPIHSGTNETIKSAALKTDLEKFIGENLINKIGIIILILGVGIGAKYAIDNELISPLTRIILGYLVGLGLLAVAVKLKNNYHNFSAVLLSGAMAIIYFITFLAYTMYGLIPQIPAFVIMVFFTIFTVIAAISYNKSVIAHIGLIGAYAVPFLLSENSGQVGFLFSYITIINIGILFISFRRYWKSLYYVAFALTWIIYLFWYVSDYQKQLHFSLAFGFLLCFFVIFYATFLSYKLIKKQNFEAGDIIMLLVNSFLFYGLGYTILESHPTGVHFLGLFTLSNGIIHFVVSYLIYKKYKSVDKSLFYLIAGLVLIFITIAIPVQLDGNKVTLLWIGEALLLFWIGRTKQLEFYEKLSYPLMALAIFSIFEDWQVVYNSYNPEIESTRITPLFNVHFLSSVLFLCAMGLINYVNKKSQETSEWAKSHNILTFINFCLPAIWVVTLYFAIAMEISLYWDQLYADSVITINDQNQDYPKEFKNSDLLKFKALWLINYTLLFVSILSFVSIHKMKVKYMSYLNLVISFMVILVFLVVGLYTLGELRDNYLSQTLSQYYVRDYKSVAIRYVSLAFLFMTLYACYKLSKQDFINMRVKTAFDLLFSISILWIASSELIHWMEITRSTQSDKLGLSILWGCFALLLIITGIRQGKKHLRIAAIFLFSITLLKLFFYDISHLNTISKTIVFIALGILLLIISFLYNKFKHTIENEDVE